MKKIFSFNALILLTFFSAYTVVAEETISKMYIFYSPSHKIFRDNWFLPSLKDDYEIVEELFPQECSGVYSMNPAWIKMMRHKIDLIIRGIHENWGGIFVYSDVDIQFFRPTKELILKAIKDKDFVIQKDSPSGILCAGFFACRANEKTLQLWQAVKQYTIDNENKSDQKALNAILKENNTFNIEWAFLPDEFMSGGTYSGKPWHPGKKLYIPQEIVLHHGNWTAGIKNKIEELKHVKTVVGQRKNRIGRIK